MKTATGRKGFGRAGSNEQADGLYERLATMLIDTQSRQTFIQDGAGLVSDPLGLEHQVRYRYSARRALVRLPRHARCLDFVTKAANREGWIRRGLQ